MSDLPLPSVPSTGYAPGVEVESADLNDYQTFMAAVKLFIETGVWNRTSLTDSTPVLAFTDPAGNVRSYFDSSGLLMGEAIYHQWSWTNSFTPASTANDVIEGTNDMLRGTTDANCSIATGNTTSPDLNFAPLELTVDDAATTEAVRLFPVWEWNDLANLEASCEFRMHMDAIGANGVDVQMGFHSASSSATAIDPTTQEYAMFSKESTDTNWRARVASSAAETGGTDNIDTTVPPIASTYQTFKVEYHGESTPVGVDAGFAVARFFIDGAEVAEIAHARVPNGGDSDQLSFVIRAKGDGTGPVGDFIASVAPVRLSYSTHLAPAVPA